MSRTLRFDIHLNNALGIYHPGDMLSGHVTVLASEDIPVHGKNMHSSTTYCHRHSSGHLLLNSFIWAIRRLPISTFYTSFWNPHIP